MRMGGYGAIEIWSIPDTMCWLCMNVSHNQSAGYYRSVHPVSDRHINIAIYGAHASHLK